MDIWDKDTPTTFRTTNITGEGLTVICDSSLKRDEMRVSEELYKVMFQKQLDKVRGLGIK